MEWYKFSSAKLHNQSELNFYLLKYYNLLSESTSLGQNPPE